MALIPAWPAELTDKSWQKKKGPIAKVAGKTGLGAAMTATEKEFKKIDWNKFEASQIPPSQKHEATILQYKAAAEKHYHDVVVPARNEILELSKKLDKQAVAWKKNKLIPAAAVKQIEELKKKSDLLAAALKGNGAFMLDRMPQYDKLIADIKRKSEAEIKTLPQAIANLETALKECRQTPTKAFWSTDMTKSAHQRCRSMCNAIRNIPPLHQKYWKTWAPFGDNYHKDAPDGGPAERTAMLKKIDTVAKELAVFKANYRKDVGL